MATISATIQFRRGDARDWSYYDYTLSAGEVGWEDDTNKFKIGDGSTAWSSLSYFPTETGDLTATTLSSTTITVTTLKGTTVSATNISATNLSAITLSSSGIDLADTTASAAGVITKEGVRFLHNFHDPTGGGAIPVGRNLFLGDTAGNFTAGSNATSTAHASKNVGIGYHALEDLTLGAENVGVGNEALTNATSGNYNVAIGSEALQALTTGSSNVGVGVAALRALTTGSSNIGIGPTTLQLITTETGNIALGSSVLNAATSNNNAGVGAGAFQYLTTGDQNIGVGYQAGMYRGAGFDALTSLGGGCLYLGNRVHASANGVTNETAIGNSWVTEMVGSGSNTVALGNPDVTDTYLAGLIHFSTGIGSSGFSATAISGSTALLATGLTAVGLSSSGIDLASTTASGVGVITKEGDRFFHDYHHPTGGGAVPLGLNCFIGLSAGNFAMGSTATLDYHSSYNIGIGAQTLLSNTKGYTNTGIGYQALMDNTEGSENIAIGTYALTNNTTGTVNIAIGRDALKTNTTGSSNVVIGTYAMDACSAVANSIAIGANVLGGHTTGNENIGIGTNCLRDDVNGNNNVAIGSYAMMYSTGITNTVAIGTYAIGGSAGTGHQNTGIGYGSLHYLTTGGHNTGLGSYSGIYYGAGTSENNTGNYSIFIGYSSRPAADGDTNEIVIGSYDGSSYCIGLGSNTVTIGNDNITLTQLKGTVLSRVSEDIDSDTDDVLSTGITSGYGMLVVRESVDQVCGIFRLQYQTVSIVDTDANLTATQDNASTYNVYWDTDQVKVQNKVGDNKNIKVGFFGV